MTQFSHFDDEGGSRMVDVGGKEVTARRAVASGRVRMASRTLSMIRECRVEKGDVLEIARLAGIMAAKKTSDWIPLCHPLPLESVELSFDFPASDLVTIQATARVHARTGVEMEALVAVSAAALTIYDMCKSVDREMTIEQVRLEEKSGGRSGHFVRGDEG